MYKLIFIAAICLSASAQAYYPVVNSIPSFEPRNTTIRHSDGSTTYIQPNGPSSGCIRYSDGRVDYYGR